jgi:adenylate cyclase
MADDEGRPTRRLIAILLADMKDYSALMGEDEAHAIAGVDDIGAVFGDVVPRHAGTYEITSGDRFFAVFESAVEAFEAAVEIQRSLARVGPRGGRALSIRMGMHLGEVVRTSFGLAGDSINIAARLEEIAEPGGIAVSGDIYRSVRSHARGVTFRDLGLQKLKNIREPMLVYAVTVHAAAGGMDARVDSRDITRGSGQLTRRLVVAGVLTAAASVALWRWSPRLRARLEQAPSPMIDRGNPLVLGVMSIRTRGEVPDWMSDLTRDGLNTVLSKQPSVMVYSRQKIDFLRQKRAIPEIEVAEQLGITKMIAATLSGNRSNLSLEVQIIDIGTGLIEGTHEARGSEDQLIEMQNDAALEVLHSLKVPIDQELTRLLSRRTNDRLDDYKLLTESMGGEAEETRHNTEPRSEGPGIPSFLPGPAWASDDEAAIASLLEHYRAALESENLGAVEALHVALPDAMRDALQRYFQNANALRVEFSKMDIVVEGDEALATFTRTDDFTDASSRIPVHLEVRVSNIVTREGTGWKIRGIKKGT